MNWIILCKDILSLIMLAIYVNVFRHDTQLDDLDIIFCVSYIIYSCLLISFSFNFAYVNAACFFTENAAKAI